jgi:CRISPR-associated endonuclease Cas2
MSTATDAANFLTQRPTMSNFLPGPRNPIYKKYRKERGKKKFNKLIYYLKRNGYIKAASLKNEKAVILTKEGIDKAIKASFKLRKPVRKDGKWVMLIFDVPEKSKGSRDLLRSILQNLGYKMFQKSVWISPYDISDKTEKLLQLHSLENYVKIFLIEEMQK